ncbi:hypothetical protein FKM82_023264 [Ascaphus truei]
MNSEQIVSVSPRSPVILPQHPGAMYAIYTLFQSSGDSVRRGERGLCCQPIIDKQSRQRTGPPDEESIWELKHGLPAVLGCHIKWRTSP